MVKYIFSSIKENFLLFLIYVILSLFSAGFALAIPQLIGIFVDLLPILTTGRDAQQILFLLFITWGAQIIMSYAHNMTAVKLHTKTFFCMTSRVMAHAKRIPIENFENDSSAYFAQRINLDTANLINFFMNNVLGAIINAFAVIFIIFIMLETSIVMTAVTLLIIPIYIAMHIVMKKPLSTSTRSLKETRDTFFSALTNQIMHIKNIKLHSLINETDCRLETQYLPVIDTAIKNAKIKQVYSITEFLAKYSISIVVFVYSLIEIINNRMTVGEFTVLNTYVGMLVSNISAFLSFAKVYETANVSYNRTMEIMNVPVEHFGHTEIEKINNIAIENLSFRYGGCNNGANFLYDGFSCKFEAGKIYALTGGNGRGKSTMLMLMLGLMRNYSGRIFYNEYSIFDINMESIRKKNIAVVTQNVDFVFDTLSENMDAYNLSSVKLQDYIKILNLENFFDGAYSNNENQESAIDMAKLSLGEKQKVSLLQAMAKNADVLLLDEPSSGLDDLGVEGLCNILQNEKNDRIIIIVTHDDALIDISDEQINI